MAILRLKSGKKQEVNHDKGISIWNMMQDPSTATEEQQVYLEQIERIWLDWHTAPDNYVLENLQAIVPLILDTWTVDNQGYPIHPGNEQSWQLSRKWGLWDHGRDCSSNVLKQLASKPIQMASI